MVENLEKYLAKLTEKIPDIGFATVQKKKCHKRALRKKQKS